MNKNRCHWQLVCQYKSPRGPAISTTFTPRFVQRTLSNMNIADFQNLIEKMYSHKDRQRGSAGTFIWFMEEVGELAAAIGEGTPDEKKGEFADVMAWLTTLANVEGIDLTAALEEKYGTGCPGCGLLVCECNEKP